MKAKNSLRAMLLPLIKQIIQIKNRLFNSRKPQRNKNNPFNLDLQKVADDGKRIAEKMQAMQLLSAQCKLQNKSPSDNSVSGEQIEKDPEDGRVLCGWREDEDDRSSKDYSILYHRQNKMCDENPEIMKAILHTFFKADHDAAQFEHYQLENRVEPKAVGQPVKPVKRFLNSGLNNFFTIILFIAVGSFHLQAQELKSPQTLRAGDPVPDITIQNLFNYPTTSAKISDFKGKLLVLDFWSTWCGTCLESFEQADAMKKQFGDQLQVLFITAQPGALINQFLLKRPGISSRKPVIATDDKALQALFPYKSVPHLAWISPEGKLIQTTASYDFTASNIDGLLKNEQVKFMAPKVDDLHFNAGKPLFDQGNGGDAHYQYRSMITAYQPGLPGHLGSRKDSTTVRVFGLNQGLIGLYKKAWQVPLLVWGDNRVLFERLERKNYEITDLYKEQHNKAWCYELVLPIARQSELYPMMQQDLTRFFKIQGMVEEREMPCLVLVNSIKKLRPAKTIGERESNLLEPDGQDKYLKNDWLSTLTEQLDSQPGMPPVFDESGISYTTNIKLGKSLTDVASLNQALAMYGLTLKSETRKLPMLILSPAN